MVIHAHWIYSIGLGLGGFPLYLNFYDIMYVIGRKR